jgi:hypothetical protein
MIASAALDVGLLLAGTIGLVWLAGLVNLIIALFDREE